MNAPLPWFIAGPLIGLIVPALLLLREKQFGISSSYRFVGAVIFPKINYFNYQKNDDRWQIQFAIGLILSGFLAYKIFGDQFIYPIYPDSDLNDPVKSVYDLSNALQFFTGGILVGFGARYANGCTAGHCIMGISQFAKSSIVATISFFIGGMIASFFINPFIY